MPRCLTLVAALAAGLLWAPARADTPSIQQLFEDIHVLGQFNRLELSRPQWEDLRRAAQGMAAERAKTGPRDTPEIRAATEAVRQALLEGRPPEDLESLFAKLKSLLPAEQEKEPEVQLRQAAQALAATFAARLRANQVVRLVGEGEKGEKGGPAQDLLNGLRKLRGAGGEARAHAPEFSLEMSRRLTQDVARAGRARSEIEAWLLKGLKLSDAELKAQNEALETEAEEIVNRALGSPLGVLLWQAEQRIAGLLMHPRLVGLVDERLKAAPN